MISDEDDGFSREDAENKLQDLFGQRLVVSNLNKHTLVLVFANEQDVVKRMPQLKPQFSAQHMHIENNGAQVQIRMNGRGGVREVFKAIAVIPAQKEQGILR